MDEFALIDRFFKRQSVHRGDVSIGIGDDAAVVRPDGRELAVTTDVLVSGVHFPETTDPAAVGHKALAVNLSDIAAMGARPAWATLGLTLPETDESWLEEFADGFLGLAAQFDVQLIGGDVTRGPLTVSVQVTGIVGENGCLTRSGARENDVIYVSGTLGDAALGLQVTRGELRIAEPDRFYLAERLNRPTPRVALGAALAGRATAAIDVSDGLAADLVHVCEASGIGATVDVARVPVSQSYRRCLPAAGWAPAISFGDDYELCFTVPPDAVSVVERLAVELDIILTPIGRMTGDSMNWLNEGEAFSIDEQGYRHFR